MARGSLLPWCRSFCPRTESLGGDNIMGGDKKDIDSQGSVKCKIT